jgi:hypothetical protein
MPRYAEGEEVTLFLHAPSRAGLSSPVGGYLGKLEVRRDASGAGAKVAAAELSPSPPRDGWLELKTMRARVAESLRREGLKR